LGFVQSSSDPGIYIYGKGEYILALYVDDIVIAGKDINWILRFKEDIKKKFKIKDLGELSWCLGMEITRDRKKRTLQISQREYTLDILEQFGMKDCNPVGVPLEYGHTTANTAKIPLTDIKPYQRLVGSLMYLAVATRGYCTSC